MALVSTSPEVRGRHLHLAPVRAVEDRVAVLAAFAEDLPRLRAEAPALLALQLGDGFLGVALPMVAQRF